MKPSNESDNLFELKSPSHFKAEDMRASCTDPDIRPPPPKGPHKRTETTNRNRKRIAKCLPEALGASKLFRKMSWAEVAVGRLADLLEQGEVVATKIFLPSADFDAGAWSELSSSDAVYGRGHEGSREHQRLCSIVELWLKRGGMPRSLDASYPKIGKSDISSGKIFIECGFTTCDKLTSALDNGCSVMSVPFVWLGSAGIMFSNKDEAEPVRQIELDKIEVMKKKKIEDWCSMIQKSLDCANRFMDIGFAAQCEKIRQRSGG